jgi:hypothetical protein
MVVPLVPVHQVLGERKCGVQRFAGGGDRRMLRNERQGTISLVDEIGQGFQVTAD